MQDKYDITDAELEIMQVLWENEECDLNTIIQELNSKEEKNRNTIKTLLRRLILLNFVENQKVSKQELQKLIDILESEE